MKLLLKVLFGVIVSIAAISLIVDLVVNDRPYVSDDLTGPEKLSLEILERHLDLSTFDPSRAEILISDRNLCSIEHSSKTTDAWGATRRLLRKNGQTFIQSSGPDGKNGTSDDILHKVKGHPCGYIPTKATQ